MRCLVTHRMMRTSVPKMYMGPSSEKTELPSCWPTFQPLPQPPRAPLVPLEEPSESQAMPRGDPARAGRNGVGVAVGRCNLAVCAEAIFVSPVVPWGSVSCVLRFFAWFALGLCFFHVIPSLLAFESFQASWKLAWVVWFRKLLFFALAPAREFPGCCRSADRQRGLSSAWIDLHSFLSPPRARQHPPRQGLLAKPFAPNLVVWSCLTRAPQEESTGVC